MRSLDMVSSPDNPLESVSDAPEVSQKVESLAKIVSDSAKENSKTSRSSKPSKPIRAGGRPRKDGAPNKATLKLMGLDSDPLDSSGPGSEKPPVDTGVPPGAQAPDPVAQTMELPPVLLRPVLNLPFKILRAQTGFDGFDLPEEAYAELIPLLDHILKQYLPATNSPHAPAFSLVTALGIFMFQQTADYFAWKKSRKPDVSEKNASDPAAAAFPVQHIRPGEGAAL